MQGLRRDDEVCTDSNGKVIAASQLGNLSDISKGGAHNNGLVPVLLVIVEDALHTLDTRVLLRSKILLHRDLVPIEDTPDKGGDEERTGFGRSDGLGKGEHKR